MHRKGLIRILVDLADAQLQAPGERIKQPRSVVIRETVTEDLERRSVTPFEAAYAFWGMGSQDGLDYQEIVRAER